MVEHRPVTAEVAGSYPVGTAIRSSLSPTTKWLKFWMDKHGSHTANLFYNDQFNREVAKITSSVFKAVNTANFTNNKVEKVRTAEIREVAQ